MLRKLLATSEYLGRFPSIGFIFIYLLSIPFFALIYTFYMPSQFYHSTVQHETVLDKDANELLSKIQATIVREFENAHGSIIKSDGRWSLDISKIKINSLKPETDKTSFKIFIKLNGVNNNKGIESSLTLTCSIKNRVSYATYSSPNFNMVIYKQPECKNKQLLPMDLKLLFPAQAKNLNSSILWLPINQEAQDAINALSKAINGFPSKASGVFARMFYFSAVTITTLGYGDIVPITSKSRTLVAIESIIGIILIGMFLNSLSRESKNA